LKGIERVLCRQRREGKAVADMASELLALAGGPARAMFFD
jgi:hypothetical protein